MQRSSRLWCRSLPFFASYNAMRVRGRRLALPTPRVVIWYFAFLLFVWLLFDVLKRASRSTFDVQRAKNEKIAIRGGFHAEQLLLRNEDPMLLENLLVRFPLSQRSIAVQLLYSHLLDGAEESGVGDAREGVTQVRRRSQHGFGGVPGRSPALDMSVFVSIASYRDRLCAYTMRSLFSQALNPGLISVGLVELSDADSGDEPCVFRPPGFNSAEWLGADALSDEEGLTAGSAELLHSRIKRIRLPVRMGKGPVFTRYFASRLYGGEAFFLMIDSHSAFTLHWDAKLFQELVAALWVTIGEATEQVGRAGGGNAAASVVAAAAMPVISHHPPAWTRRSTDVDTSARDLLEDEGPAGWKPVEADSIGRAKDGGTMNNAVGTVVPFLCHAKFDYPELGFPVLYSIQRHISADHQQQRHRPRSNAELGGAPIRQPFVGAGLVFTSASVLAEVPFDPHLPYLFHGEEILLSARLWTSGYDSFAPRDVILRHYYYRRESPKYHEDRRKLQDDVNPDVQGQEEASVRRVQYYLQSTRYVVPWERSKRPIERFVRSAEEVRQSSDDEVAWYGMGSVRTLDAFWKFAGVDPRERVCNLTKWCCFATVAEVESCLAQRNEH